MSDSSDEEAVPVAPRARKRRKLAPLVEDPVVSTSGATASTSLTALSGDYLQKTSAIDAVPTIKTKAASLDVTTAIEKEKPKKDYSFLISSSSEEENDLPPRKDANRSPSPPPAGGVAPPPPPQDDDDEDYCCYQPRGKRNKRKPKRKSAPARKTPKISTTRKAQQGIKAVQQLRSLHSRMQDETWSESLKASFRMMHEGMSDALKEDEIVIKVRSPSGVQRFTQLKRESLSKAFAKMAEIENCELECIVMTLDDREVKITDSPESLNLTVVDILECVVLRDAGSSSQEATEEETESGDGSIRIKIQSVNSRSGKPVVVKIMPGAPMSEMMDLAAKELGEDKSKLTFRFDGEIVNPESTAIDYDMEDDDCVDVVSKN